MGQYKQLTGAKQVIFALGHIGPGSLNQFITTWLMISLTSGENVIMNSSLVGVSLMIGRLVDAVADPLVANWSDRFANSRFGRRMPFMIGGTIPMILSFNMLWYTRFISGNNILRFLWILGGVNLFYFAYTVVVNPYFALLPEIASEKKQRMFIQSFVALFGILGMGISMGASGFLIDRFGYGGAGLIMSILCAVVMAGPLLTVRINPGAKALPAEESSSSNLLVSLKSALSNKSFRTYILGFCIFFLGFQMIQYNMAFLTTVLLDLDRGMSSILFITSVVTAVLLIPVYNLIMKKLASIDALRLAVGSFMVIAILMALLPVLLGSSGHGMILGFALMALLGFPYSGMMVIPNILVSEIIDEDIRVNHMHREALFFGVQGLINKFMVSIAALTVGFILDVFGNSTEHPAGVILVAPIAAVVALIGFLVMTHLNISKEESE
jgi:GPH family glycoside/pentoside/hexuronide:cation symporter